MVSSASRPAAVMMVMITAIPTIERIGIARCSHSARPRITALKSKPSTMGTITIWMIPIIMSRKSMGTN